MTEPVLRIQSHLTTRDHILLGWLADHGVLTSFQIAHALFPSVDFAQERLRKLTNLKVLGRFRPQKPDGGSYPYHYVLDQLGVDVVAAQRGEPMPRRDQARLRRWHLTNRANLPHLLGTNQFFIDLAGYARTHPGASLDRWWPAARCQQMGAFAEPGEDNVTVLAYRPRVRPDGHGIFTHGLRRVSGCWKRVSYRSTFGSTLFPTVRGACGVCRRRLSSSGRTGTTPPRVMKTGGASWT